MSRPSAYLKNKCEALEEVVMFFLSKSGAFC